MWAPPPPTTPSVHYSANGKSPLHQQGAVAYGSNGEVVVPTLESMANGANGGGDVWAWTWVWGE